MVFNSISGGMYKDECPIQPLIPIYLIVAGVFGLIDAIFRIVFISKKAKASTDTAESTGFKAKVGCIGCTEGFIGFFLFCWFIAGKKHDGHLLVKSV